MTSFEALILGVLQGLTEFLPVSSSGHLIFGEAFLGLKVETLKSFDVMAHMGTLMAILVYFRRDLKGMLGLSNSYAKLVFYIVIGTIPAVVFGLTLEDLIDKTFRNVNMVAILMIIVGIIFILGEFVYKKVHSKAPLKQKFMEGVDSTLDSVLPDGYEPVEIRGMNFKKALLIGFAQAMALLPGVSRSGATIVAGLFQGIKRESAARFSFLLAIPAIFGAGLLTALKNGGDLTSQISATSLLIGFASSFVVGLLAISFLMRFLKNHTLRIFAIYLMILGFGVLLAQNL